MVMLLCVRTTVRLPDDLYSQVRVTAAQTDGTVTSYIEEALRAALARHAKAPTVEPYRVDAFGSGGVLPGVDPGRPGAAPAGQGSHPGCR